MGKVEVYHQSIARSLCQHASLGGPHPVAGSLMVFLQDIDRQGLDTLVRLTLPPPAAGMVTGYRFSPEPPRFLVYVSVYLFLVTADGPVINGQEA